MTLNKIKAKKNGLALAIRVSLEGLFCFSILFFFVLCED
jgi:hypothetical protein